MDKVLNSLGKTCVRVNLRDGRRLQFTWWFVLVLVSGFIHPLLFLASIGAWFFLSKNQE